jgi:dTDP-4-dehydrorhamnose 3,5-epimerase-like enzyme
VNTPTLLQADLAVDDRGQLTFCNDLDFASLSIRRLYLTRNHRPNLVRAWHGHKKESKYVLAVSGAALVCTVPIDNWANPFVPFKFSGERFVLSAALPRVLAIPPGYANGWKSLTPDCQLLWFSTATVEESAADDYRWDARYWNPWEVKER